MTPQELISELTEACQPIVEAIEASPPVTKDRYDQYMVAIAKIADRLKGSKAGSKADDKTLARLAAVALTYAKGNKRGIQAALRVMGYL